MSQTACPQQFELFEVGRQQVTMSFDGGAVVSDAGLLPVRQLDQELGLLAEAARRLPDPRSELFVVHSAERILTQQVYQILAGYPDGNDAQLLRDDPLFKTIAGMDPREKEQLLASQAGLDVLRSGGNAVDAIVASDREVSLENDPVKAIQNGYNALSETLQKSRRKLHGVLRLMAL